MCYRREATTGPAPTRHRKTTGALSLFQLLRQRPREFHEPRVPFANRAAQVHRLAYAAEEWHRAADRFRKSVLADREIDVFGGRPAEPRQHGRKLDAICLACCFE